MQDYLRPSKSDHQSGSQFLISCYSSTSAVQRQAVEKKGGSSKSSQSLHGVIIDQSKIYFQRALFLFNEAFYCSSIRNAQQCSIQASLAFSCPRMQKNGGLLQLVCNIFILVAAKLPATNLRQPDFYRTFSLFFFHFLTEYH